MYIVSIILLLLIIGLLHYCIILKKHLNNHIELEQKNYLSYSTCRNWLGNYNLDRFLYKYFEELNYKRIAVYGLGEIGQLFVDEMKKSKIQVVYGIDQQAKNIYADMPIILPDSDDYKDVDVIVVTPTFAFDKIKTLLERKVKCPIISLDEIIWEV